MSVKREKPVVLHDNWEERRRYRNIKTPNSAHGEHEGDWRKLVNANTGQAVHVRLYEPDDGAVIITGILFDNMNGVTSQDLRQFPVAAIQAAFRESSDAIKYMERTLVAAGFSKEEVVETSIENGIASKQIHTVMSNPEFDPTEKIRRKKHDDKFYALVAIQFMHFSIHKDENIAHTISSINEISIPTAQRWLWEARQRKFLPPGKQGRRTKKQDTSGEE